MPGLPCVLFGFAALLAVAGCGGTDVPASSSEGVSVIPGLVPADVYLDLERAGFATTRRFSEAGKEWRLSRETAEHRFDVEVFGPDAASVSSIRATVTALGENDAATEGRGFLGGIAGVAYRGSQPAEARRWVEGHVGQGGQASFGPVRFVIGGEGRGSRALRIMPTSAAAELNPAAARAMRSPP
jgi:hypothetical protein